jgi:PAS domain-containing protein
VPAVVAVKTEPALAVLEALPFAALIVDRDMRILATNRAAESLLDPARGSALGHRGGEAMSCVNAGLDPAGCGSSAHCTDCVLRRTVAQAADGQRSIRARARLVHVRDGVASPIHLLVTASPLELSSLHGYLLMLEDIAQLLEVGRLLPICAHCKKVRDRRQQWKSVESYFSDHLDVDFSHGLCPACAQELYPDLGLEPPP